MESNIKEALTEEIISKAGELYGVSRDGLESLGGFENFVYEYQNGNNFYILRLAHSSHRLFEHVEAELEFIEFLHKNGGNVSNVIHSIEGNFLEKIKDNIGGYFTVCVFEKASGTFVDRKAIDDDFNFMFGAAVGKLHRLTKTFEPIKKRYHWNEEDFIDIGRRNLSVEDAFVLKKAEDIVNKISTFKYDSDSYGLIHTDLHFGNMYYDNNILTFFDWDDSSYKYFISDIAIIIFYQFAFSNITEDEKEHRTKLFLDSFMPGYETENHLDFEWFYKLNDFLKLREIILYIVIIAAGEEMIQSGFGKMFLSKYRDRIKNDIPFLNINNILEKVKWKQ